MNHSLVTADRTTHLKIVAVSLVAAIAVILVGVTARISDTGATAKVTGQTGVEMEALTAVAVACLTIYDMVKAVERGMRIEGIRLIEKSGGKSGHYRAKE